MVTRARAAIIGIGEVPTGKYPDRSARAIACSVMKQAIEDAGLSKEEIDVIMPTGSRHDPAFERWMNLGGLVEALGIHPRANLYVFTGGSSGSTILETAAGMVAGGLARNVLCVQADKLGTSQGAVGDRFVAGDVAWELPFGYLYNATGALVSQRYMFETGTTEEQLASVCVSNRRWAELNPNAMYRKPLTVKEVLDSPVIASPLHALEINRMADGGAAFVVTSAERAKAVCDAPAYVLGLGSRAHHFTISQCRDITRLGFPDAAQEAYAMAGITPRDVDVVEAYDGYPVFPLIALEGLGCCARGEAGKFVLEGHTAPGGRLPLSTNGGILSQGFTGAGGSFASIVEAARQLMGKAGERQVRNAEIAAVTSSGGPWFDSHVAILGRDE